MAIALPYNFVELAREWRLQRCAKHEDPNDAWELIQHLERLLGGPTGALPSGWMDATGGEWPCSYPRPGTGGGGGGGGGGGNGGGGMFDSLSDSAINCIWGKRSDIANLYSSNGWPTGSVAERKRCLNNWWGMTTEAKPATPEAFAQAMGCITTPPKNGDQPPKNDIADQLFAFIKANPIPTIIVAWLLFIRR